MSVKGWRNGHSDPGGSECREKGYSHLAGMPAAIIFFARAAMRTVEFSREGVSRKGAITGQQVADELGVHRGTLYRALREHRLRRKTKI